MNLFPSGAIALSLLGIAGLIPASVKAQSVTGQAVRFKTVYGDIDVQLLPSAAPKTVANFLNYVNKGAYKDTFFHRSVRRFVIQSGGYRWQDTSPNIVDIPADAPVTNEFNVSNRRGTLAMAKLDGDPNSATNEFFFNLNDDNAANLDNNNGGFTVFGRIVNAAGLAVMDRLAAIPVYAAESPFGEIPLIDFTSGTIQKSQLALISSIEVLSTPEISANGLVTASNFGAYSYAAPATYVEIYGSNLAPQPGRSWTGADFNNTTAPTTLDGVRVTVNGLPAYISYISPGQLNLQLPGNLPAGRPVSVVVNNQGMASPAVQFPIRATAPGLLAPASFKVGDKQFVVALRPDGSYVSNGTVPGIPAAPAAAGETVVLYGVGFGPVAPSSISIAGQIASGLSSISTPLQIKIGGTTAAVSYAGLAPNYVGVYQFNVVIPAGLPPGDLPLTVSLGGEAMPQNLWIPIKN